MINTSNTQLEGFYILLARGLCDAQWSAQGLWPCQEDALCGAVGKTDLLEALREAGCQLTQTEEDGDLERCSKCHVQAPHSQLLNNAY